MEIKFKNVNFYYDKKTKEKVVDSIDLKIKSNTIVGITGKSGSGKTTLLEILAGLKVPTSGKITLDDIFINKKKDFDLNKLRTKISYVVQNCEDQIFNKTVKEELVYTFKLLNKEITDEKILENLKLVGLSESFLDRNPLTLSNGEMRKLVIASTLILDTEVIIFDEPVIGLDASSVKNFVRLIKNLKNNYNKTIIVASKDVELIHKISDQVVILNDGKVLLEGDKYDVFKNIDILNENGIPVPKTIEFSTLVLNKKHVRIGYRDEINDLLKDIYRYVR